MSRNKFIFILILFSGLYHSCTKNDPEKDLTNLTIGTKSIGIFTPEKTIAYKTLEGYIVELSSDTITFSILLPELKKGSYVVTNEDISDSKAIFNIGFKQEAYSASEGTISISDTSNNRISGTYSVTNSTNGNGEILKISNGKFDNIPIEDYVYGIVEDFEHNQYKTITIGPHTWMAQNLRSFIYSNGDSIEGVYRYNKNNDLMNTYGLYYTWPAAMNNSNTENTQGACPTGWHLPSDNEWEILIDELGGETVAGGKLMSMLTWDVPNGWACNVSGFSALGAGIHHPVSEYPDFSDRMGIQTYFWSSTYSGPWGKLPAAWSIGLTSGKANILRSPYYRTDMGFSVRCLKN